MAEKKYKTFEEFWPYYLGEHSSSANRRAHQIGTTLALGTVAAAIVLRKPALLPLALVAGYGPAWVGHFLIEKNRPATFTYPLWSLIGDFKMNGLMWSGQLEAELRRHGIGADGRPSEVEGR